MMRRDEVVANIEPFFREYCNCLGFELFDLTYKFENGNNVLRFLVDRPLGGISLDECAGLNKKISILMEEKAFIEEGYMLEVCSPGLDRPLRTKSDFYRCLNRHVKFFLSEQINGKIELDGLVKQAHEDKVVIESADQTLDIPLNKINKAKQIV